jgi:putative FmdB family regulatory protein
MSKLILFQFGCLACGNSFEELTKPADYWSKCPKCGANARREITPVRIDKTRMACTAGATETSIKHFDRVHKQRKAIEEKSFRDHGDYGKPAGCD